MRVLVCGDRNWTNAPLVRDTLDALNQDGPHGRPGISVLIEGEARGADTMARDWALLRDVPCLRVPAQWSKYGKAAGPIRNQVMLDEGKPDLVIAFHSDLEHSKGTRDMVSRARRAGVEVRVITGRKPALAVVPAETPKEGQGT